MRPDAPTDAERSNLRLTLPWIAFQPLPGRGRSDPDAMLTLILRNLTTG